MSSSAEKDNLVMTLAHRYDWEKLRVFVNSLNQSGFQGELVVFGSSLSSDTIQKLREHGATVIEVRLPLFRLRNIFLLTGWKHWRFLLNYLERRPELKTALTKAIFNIMCVRFVYFHEYLKNRSNQYQKVLVADCRDVCFQSDPFEKINHDEVVSFLEGTTIGESSYNKLWLTESFGERICQDLLNHEAICAGVTLGGAACMLEYLHQMVDTCCKVIHMQPVAGADQGIHNGLLHRHAFKKSTLYKLDNPICLTLGCGVEPRTQNGTVVDSSGTTVSMLHQYDRNPDLKQLIENKFH
jgi:hypothetical protein